MSKPKAKILLVDDELIKLTVVKDQLEACGYFVATACNPLEAQPMLGESFDVVITDLRMPGRDGLSFLRDLRKLNPCPLVIVMTAFGTVETAIDAMKLGACDYLQKPFLTEELVLKLDRLLQQERLATENTALRGQLAALRSESRIVGKSRPIQLVLERIGAINESDSSVLIEGESGTGKELVAQTIHRTSWRREGPFVALTCAALPKDLIETELFGHEAGAFTGATKRRLGRFELARGGTLFLDEVDDIPPQVQVKLLRVLQERHFERVGGEQTIEADVRIIAASKRPLGALVVAGQFRDDLFYRLNTIPIRIPPLRERREDVPVLVEYLLKRLAIKLNRPEMSLSPEALERLADYSWPGNVRELENVLERVVVLTRKSRFDVDDLPPLHAPQRSAPGELHLEHLEKIHLPVVVEDLEDRLVLWAMERSEGNMAKAAQILGVARSTLQYKVARAYNGAKAEH